MENSSSERGIKSKKLIFSNEVAYVVGMILVAFSVACMEKANFGVSMVVAPAYLLHLKISPTYSFFTFGMAEYTLQTVLLVVMILVLRKFRLSYFFSFVTAVLYGFILDFWILLFDTFDASQLWLRIVLYLAGIIIGAFGISLFFHSYISPEVYELFVKEVSKKVGMDINKFKTIYDCTSCALSVILSFVFFGFGHFEGIKLGTIICALCNGFIIGVASKFFDSHFEFKDSLPWRKYFE